MLSQRKHLLWTGLSFESRFLIAGEPYLCKPANIFLYYSGKKPPKFVGFKIRSMPSRLVFLLLVLLEHFGDDSRGGLEIQPDVFGCSICRFANKWRCDDYIDQILLHGVFSILLWVHPSLLVSGEKRGKMRSKPAFRYQMKLIKVFFASWGIKFKRCGKNLCLLR